MDTSKKCTNFFQRGDKPPYIYPLIDAGFVVNKVEPLVTSSISLVYSRLIVKNTYISLGLNKNVKGFKELGEVHNGTTSLNPIAPYTPKRKANYYGFLL